MSGFQDNGLTSPVEKYRPQKGNREIVDEFRIFRYFVAFWLYANIDELNSSQYPHMPNLLNKEIPIIPSIIFPFSIHLVH